LSLRFLFGFLAIAIAAVASAPTSGESILQSQLRTRPSTFCHSTNTLPVVIVPPGGIKPLYHQIPLYPPKALRLRIEGTVRLEACIAPSGEVTEVLVISGPPLLRRASMEAASHWRFAPVRWRGEPAQAATEIDVPFRLEPEAPQKNRPAKEI
jgi:TonB family protein